MKEAKWDRRNYVPYHEPRDNVIPADPLFTRLLALSYRPVQRPAIRDLNAGVEKTFRELFLDSLNLRDVIRSHLKPQTLQNLRDGNEVYISVLGPGGYEFTVAILAVLALGAGASPFSPHQPVKEAAYYVNKAKSVAVVCATSALKLGQDLASEIQSTTDPSFQCVCIADGLNKLHKPLPSIIISNSGYRDLNSPGVVIFTSGTTGPPKAALLPLSSITDGATAFAEQLQIKETDTCQHILPVHHATGIWVSFFPFILSGACIEFKSGSFDPQWTWNRWKEGGITHFSGVPTIFMRMMRYYKEVLSKLPADELEPYKKAPLAFRVALCGTSALPKPINDFWTGMMGGRRIMQRYGSTEQGVIFHQPFHTDPNVPDGSIGELSMGCDVKLSEGDEGEVRSKAFYMFSKYLHDPEATKAAFDEDGFFLSGDIARREGKYYFIVGRASVDIIKSGGYKISALDIEREILALPYVNEVMVVGVPDDEFGQRVAAVVSLSDSEAAQEFYAEHKREHGTLLIDDLRSDVRSRLAGYKMPTLLRVISGDLPKGPTNKVVKKILGPQYFPDDYAKDADIQRWKSKSRQAKL